MIFDQNSGFRIAGSWSRARHVLLLLAGCGWLSSCVAEEPSSRRAEPAAAHGDFIVLPNATNAVQLRLYTDAATNAPHLFNTFEITAFDEILVKSPAWPEFQRAPDALPHNLLVNGNGPQPGRSNSLAVVERASGPDWQYVLMDGSAAYRKQLKDYKRGVLFVEPDLFVVYDHCIANASANCRVILHPPAATQVDTIWGDLRLELPKAGLRVHAPAPQKKVRNWQPIQSAAYKFLPGTVSMQLGPTNQLAELNLVTVFAVHRGGEKHELAFRLLDGNNAIGARIHRDGYPTLVAFRVNPAVEKTSLTGFEFSGPVGVSVFKPKTRK